MAKHETEGARQDQQFQEAPVIYRSDDCPDGKDNEGLNRADPRDVRRGLMEECSAFVKGLVVTKGSDNT